LKKLSREDGAVLESYRYDPYGRQQVTSAAPLRDLSPYYWYRAEATGGTDAEGRVAQWPSQALGAEYAAASHTRGPRRVAVALPGPIDGGTALRFDGADDSLSGGVPNLPGGRPDGLHRPRAESTGTSRSAPGSLTRSCPPGLRGTRHPALRGGGG